MRVLLASAQAAATSRLRTATVAQALRARGHDVIVATDAVPLGTDAMQLSAWSAAKPWWRAIGGLLTIIRAIRRYRVHAIHACTPAARPLASLAARLTRVALVDAVGDEAPVEQLEQACRNAYVATTRFEIPILCYHRLVETGDEVGSANIHLCVKKFEAQLQYLRDHGYRTMHFRDLTAADVFDPRDRRVMLTFDDGYEDNYRLLFPLLKRYQVKAVIYLVAGLDRNAWDDRLGEPSLRLLSAEERREMLASGLVEFGAHTVTHCDLSTATPETTHHEIRQSKEQLEADLGCVVETMAYPYGRLSAVAKDAAERAGFRFALALNSGPKALFDDAFHVRRIVVFPGITPARFARRVTGRYVQRPSSDTVAMPVLTDRYADAALGPAV